MNGIEAVDALFEVFNNRDGEEQPVFCVLRAPPSADTKWPPIDIEGLIKALRSRKAQERAFYMSTMWVRPGEVRNQQSRFAMLTHIVLDDVGQKVDPNKVPPTYIIESSKGSYQWGYVLRQPITDLALADRFVRTAYEADLSDRGGKLVNKFTRLPAGWNGKLRDDGTRNDFQVRLAEMHPERLFTWEELLEAWGLELVPERGERTLPMSRERRQALNKALAARGDEDALRALRDPYLNALLDLGLVHVAAGVEDYQDTYRVHITCPWVHEHTGGDASGTVFFGRPGFRCHHDHCSHRGIRDLKAWMREEHGIDTITLDTMVFRERDRAILQKYRGRAAA